MRKRGENKVQTDEAKGIDVIKKALETVGACHTTTSAYKLDLIVVAENKKK